MVTARCHWRCGWVLPPPSHAAWPWHHGEAASWQLKTKLFLDV
jgi:hypothetical protein